MSPRLYANFVTEELRSKPHEGRYTLLDYIEAISSALSDLHLELITKIPVE